MVSYCLARESVATRGGPLLSCLRVHLVCCVSVRFLRIRSHPPQYGVSLPLQQTITQGKCERESFSPGIYRGKVPCARLRASSSAGLPLGWPASPGPSSLGSESRPRFGRGIAASRRLFCVCPASDTPALMSTWIFSSFFLYFLISSPLNQWQHFVVSLERNDRI